MESVEAAASVAGLLWCEEGVTLVTECYLSLDYFCPLKLRGFLVKKERERRNLPMKKEKEG